MRRKVQFAAMAVALLAASARGGPSPRIGVLTVGDDAETTEARAALVDALRLVGPAASTVERAAPAGEPEARAALLDLQHENVEVVVAVGDAASTFARAAVRDRWVVCAQFDEGQAAQIADGGNACVITGCVSDSLVDELRRAAPGLKRVGVFVPAGDEAARTSARNLGREVETVVAQGDGATPRAAATAAARELVSGVDAVWIPPSVSGRDAAELAAALAASGVPLIGSRKSHLDAGCAVVVRADPGSVGSLAAVLARQIAGGADPGKLPPRRARRVRVEVNLPAARRLALSLPPALLAWADSIRSGTAPR